MRCITSEAGANVAAVKYHFGCRERLIEEVLATATSSVSFEQARRMDELEARPGPAPVRDWLEAWAGPLVAVVVSDRPEERRLGRIIANALSEPTALAPHVRNLAATADRRLIAGLAQAMAPMDERELWLRLALMASATAGLAGGVFDPFLERAATGMPLDVRLLDLLEAIVRSPAGGAPGGGAGR